MQNRARKFVADWTGETRENAEAQTWWNEFFQIFGVERRRYAAFERDSAACVLRVLGSQVGNEIFTGCVVCLRCRNIAAA